MFQAVSPPINQELKNCTCSIWYLLSLVAAAACTVFKLLMMGGETS
jgi:hypothetical protein